MGQTRSSSGACEDRRVEARRRGRVLGATWPLRRGNRDGAAGIWTCEGNRADFSDRSNKLASCLASGGAGCTPVLKRTGGVF